MIFEQWWEGYVNSSPMWATLKVQTAGGWYNDIKDIADHLGTTVDAILALNPDIQQNNFPQDNYHYVPILVRAGTVEAPSTRYIFVPEGKQLQVFRPGAEPRIFNGPIQFPVIALDGAEYKIVAEGEPGYVDSDTPTDPYNPEVPDGTGTGEATVFNINNNISPLPKGTYYVTQYAGGGHRGIDLGTNQSAQPITPVQVGVVEWVQAWDGVTLTGNQSWGNAIRIKHTDPDGTVHKTLYAHMVSPSSLSVGDRVALGTVMGNVGATGNAKGIHLHLEVWDANGGLLNPSDWIPF